ncbi:MAG: phosphoenolpyruvate--protein phosphotransferase [Phycisphaerales bacterium]|nr:MAG: phosphoenolpyruvate--protein phosphotransferase [Phycisphaerales bacterium]
MDIVKGIAVSPGVVIGEAVILDRGAHHLKRRYVEPGEADGELQVLETAFKASLEEVRTLRRAATEQLGDETAAIFDWHMGVLGKDRHLRQQIEDLIREERMSAAAAVSQVMHGYKERFLKMKDPIFVERTEDVRDVEQRLIRNLLGDQAEVETRFEKPSIILSYDLTPSQTAQMNTDYVVGLATDVGGLTSHMAIIAHSLHIPAVVGLGSVTSKVKAGDTVIIDGTHGLVICRPNESTLARYREEAEKFRVFELSLKQLRDLPAVTRDGVEVSLLGNIEFPSEARTCMENGADGVGLYRTEYLYLRGNKEPSEEEHIEAYTTALEACDPKPLTIRTMDLGADKYGPLRGAESERNPFLGLRSIRYCLQNLDLFKTQLRAILRVSRLGNVRVMFPLIISLMELRQAKMALGDAMEDLEEEGLEFNRSIEIGMMIETPAAALLARQFAKEVDFFSIGTNDLVQYTLAVDRSNQRVATSYTPSHPAVIRLVRDVLRTAVRMEVSCGVCGEMAGEPVYTLLLLGLGLRQFSMVPGNIPQIKKLIRSTTVKHAERVAARALSFDTDRQVRNYLRDETARLLPEVL